MVVGTAVVYCGFILTGNSDEPQIQLGFGPLVLAGAAAAGLGASVGFAAAAGAAATGAVVAAGAAGLATSVGLAAGACVGEAAGAAGAQAARSDGAASTPVTRASCRRNSRLVAMFALHSWGQLRSMAAAMLPGLVGSTGRPA